MSAPKNNAACELCGVRPATATVTLSTRQRQSRMYMPSFYSTGSVKRSLCKECMEHNRELRKQLSTSLMDGPGD